MLLDALISQIKIHPLDFIIFQEFGSKHGEDSLILSTERRKKWFIASKRSDMNVNALYHIVCSVDFVSVETSCLI